MQEPYNVETVNQEYYAPAPKRGMSGWLIALIVVAVLIVLCCLCACVASLVLTPVVQDTFPAVMETLEALTPMP